MREGGRNDVYMLLYLSNEEIWWMGNTHATLLNRIYYIGTYRRSEIIQTRTAN